MDEADKRLEEMILSGAVEISAIDSATGEILYRFTDKVQDLYPQIHQTMQKEFHDEIMFLWQKGFINMDVSALNPMVTLAELAFDSNAVASLPTQYRQSLQVIMDALRIR